MSRLQPFPIAGGSYKDDTLPWSAQDTVNWLPVAAEKPGTTSPMLLRGVPGLQTVVASGQSAGLPVRGGYDADGFCVVVIGQSLYRFDGSATTLLGTIPGIQRVQFAHNQVAGGVQIAIATGTGGYVYDTAAQTLAQITDDAFPGAKSFAYMDSYIIGVDPTGNFWFNSDLANATSYNALNRYEAESEPDRIQTLLVSHEDVVIFGARTTEFWYDSGANINTFQRRDGTGFEIGCVSPWAAVNLDNTVYWRGHDGSAYRLDGYTAQRISTGPIEQDWAKSDPSQCFAMTFVDRGHKIVYWTQPDGKTWGYDVATGEWHRRASHLMDRWRANCLFRHKTTWYAGDYTNGQLYALGWKVNTEGGNPLVAERTTTVMQDDRNRFRFNAVEVVMDAQDSAVPIGFAPFAIIGNLPGGAASVAIDFHYSLTGGATPYGNASIISGALPTGLSIDATAHVTGTVTAGGAYAWEVGAADGAGTAASLTDSATFYVPATFDPARNTNNTLSSNNTIVTQNTIPGGTAVNVNKTSGKWYLEFTALAVSGNAASCQLTSGNVANPIVYNGGTSAKTLELKSDGAYYDGGVFHGSGGPVWNTTGTVIGLAFDAGTRQAWIRDAGGWALGADPAISASPFAALPDNGVGVTSGIAFNSGSQSVKMTAGQTSFAYSIPDGFSPLSTP